MSRKLTAILEVNGVMRTKVADRMLLDSVTETFREVFSEEFSAAFYDYLERTFSIPRPMIPERLNEFQSALSKIFGQSGGSVLVRAIAKRLYLRVGLRFAEKPDYTLLQYVIEAEASLEKSRVESGSTL
jgi:hypothetical protein